MNFILLSLLILSVIVIAYILVGFIVIVSLQQVFGQSTQTVLPNQGLRQVPQDYYTVVLPPAGVQQQSSFQGFGMENVMTAVSTFLASTGLSKYLDNKDKKEVKQELNQTKEVLKDVSQTQVEQVVVQKEALKLQYENLPNKGNDINGKEEIKLSNVKKLEDKALDTAKKA